MIWGVGLERGLLGVEIPVTPHEPDVLDAGRVLEVFAVGALATGSSIVSGCGVV